MYDRLFETLWSTPPLEMVPPIQGAASTLRYLQEQEGTQLEGTYPWILDVDTAGVGRQQLLHRHQIAPLHLPENLLRHRNAATFEEHSAHIAITRGTSPASKSVQKADERSVEATQRPNNQKCSRRSAAPNRQGVLLASALDTPHSC